MLTMLDLFSGIGGFSLAADWTGGINTVAFCEIEPFCQKVLKKHWPDVPIISDIRELRGGDFGTVDIICGGFPCQPFSTSGKKRGKEDDRYLWPEMFRIISEIRPTWVIGENVENAVRMVLDEVLCDLEGIGYEAVPFVISSYCSGAWFDGKRVFIVAATNDRGSALRRNTQLQAIGSVEERRRDHGRGTPELVSGQRWQVESRPPGVANGIPDRVDRLKCLGNSIVPQVAFQILQGIVDIEKEV